MFDEAVMEFVKFSQEKGQHGKRWFLLIVE